MKEIDNIKDRIEQLGGVDFLDRKKSQKIRDQILEKENLGELIITFIDMYGFATFNKTIGYKTIKEIPIVGESGLCGIELIFGWGKDVQGVKWNLEQLKDQDIDNFFPFAEGYPGDYVCICTEKSSKKDKIYYWNHDDGKMYQIANSFYDFVMSWVLAPEEKSDDDNLIDSWFADDF